jgi:hypothetical protein
VDAIADLTVTIGFDGTVRPQSHTASIHRRASSSETPGLQKDALTVEPGLQVGTLPSPGKLQGNGQGKLVTAEEVVEGRISFKSLKLFLGALGGRHPMLLLVSWLSAVISSRLILILRVWFLGFWGSQYETHGPSEVPVQRQVPTS